MINPLTILPLLQIPAYEDIRGPVFIWDTLLIALVLSALLLIAVAIYIWSKKRSQKPATEPINERPEPSGVALSQLKELRQSAKSMEAETFTVKITTIIRHYLEDALTIPAPELTTEEFLEVISTKEKSIPILHKVMPPFLQQCDLVKFARQGLEQEAKSNLINEAEELVIQIKEAPRPETERSEIV